MSDHFLVLWPADPAFVPGDIERERALALFKTLAPNSDEIEAVVTDDVAFIDCGSNFETVSCPHCDADLQEMWGEWMETAAASSFTELDVDTPCCDKRVSMNDLIYNFPMGFARFSLTAMNANIGGLLEPDGLKQLSDAVATPLRQTSRQL